MNFKEIRPDVEAKMMECIREQLTRIQDLEAKLEYSSDVIQRLTTKNDEFWEYIQKLEGSREDE